MKSFFSILSCLFIISLHAEVNRDSVQVVFSNEKIRVDGILDELSWKNADSAHRFWQNFPYDTSFSNTNTTVKLLSDKQFLYIGAICYDRMKDKQYVITSLKRDYAYLNNDAFSVHINPFNDLTNGFTFTVNPYGVQMEGLIQGGGSFGIASDWDNKWYSETHRFDGGYIVEMAIPFKTLRFNVGDSFWRVNFSRVDLKTNERSAWKPVPRNLNLSSLVNTGRMFFQKLPVKPKFNAALIPYVIANIDQPNSSIDKFNIKPNVGLDAKIVLTPSLNLDITSNPDFAQVDVDRQVINLTRFSVFFPERRNFFLENSDLFASFGFRIIRPFFSRMIGLERGVNIPIQAGARLSGKIGRDWRVGLMNIQTGDYQFNDSTRSIGQNFTVAAFQRQVFKSSNIAGIFVNKVQLFNPGKFNRVAGLDYNLQSRNGKWLGKAFWHQSFSPEKNMQSFANATWLYYTDKKMSAMWNHEYVNKDYNAEVGFVPRIHYYDMRENKAYRLSYYRLEPEFNYKFFPKSKKINNINPSIYSDIYRNADFTENDALVNPSLTVNFQNSAFAVMSYNYVRTNLMFYTDVLGNGMDTFNKGVYQYGGLDALYQSNRRKTFSYYIYAFKGTFFDGKRENIKLELNYRIQPRFVMGLISNFEFITLPALDSASSDRKRNLTLLAPSFEFSFSRKLFFTTYVQYNSQADNINFYSRLQWRFRPMSDVFAVYSDNYRADWKARNRSFTIKLVMWLNT